MKSQPELPGKSKAEQIMEKWVEALARLQFNQYQLDLHIRKAFQQANTRHIGQCPVKQLTKLNQTMLSELKQLLWDLNQLDDLDLLTERRLLKKLVRHTHRVNRLNHQAQIRLDLAERPAA